MEACFSQLTLDVIGKAVFNYDFDALNTQSPVIQVWVWVCVWGGGAGCMWGGGCAMKEGPRGEEGSCTSLHSSQLQHRLSD